MLLDQLDQQLKTTEDDCKGYKEFLELLESHPDEDSSQDYDAQIISVRGDTYRFMWSQALVFCGAESRCSQKPVYLVSFFSNETKQRTSDP